MKKCPYCAEEIQEQAIKCKHCGEWLKKETDSQSKHISYGSFATTSVVEKPSGTKHVLKGIGWLELLIAYLCVFVPIGIIMAKGKISPVFENWPDLRPLGYIDSLLRFILIFMSIHAGVCLLKSSKGAVNKVKIFLIALLVFSIVVVEGIYSLAIYVVMARANLNLPASVVLDSFMSDIVGVIAISTVVVSWYIYLNRSQRVREIFNNPQTRKGS
jgi:hypothetical protein